MQRKSVVTIILAIILLIFNFNISFADVGSFEDYDYDSDFGDSSWGSSDWGSSDWSSGYDWGDSFDWEGSSDWGSNYGSTYNVFGVGSTIVIIIVLGIFIAIIMSNKGKRSPDSILYERDYSKARPIMNDTFIERKIKAVDELFSKEQFLSFARNLFIKMQEAWTKRDWSTIRPFEMKEIFEQHQRQLQNFIDKKQINVMERICVKAAYLSSFEQTGSNDILTVVLETKMIDYIIDETTGEIIKGDKETERHSTYKMVFIRKSGIKTSEGEIKLKTTNCPNCGAPTEITSSGKCEYCGSIIVTENHDWSLANLEKIA